MLTLLLRTYHGSKILQFDTGSTFLSKIHISFYCHYAKFSNAAKGRKSVFYYLFLFILSFISDKNNLKITNKSKNNLQIDNKILCTYIKKKLKNKNIKTVFIEWIKSEAVLSVKLFT